MDKKTKTAKANISTPPMTVILSVRDLGGIASKVLAYGTLFEIHPSGLFVEVEWHLSDAEVLGMPGNKFTGILSALVHTPNIINALPLARSVKILGPYKT